MTANLPPRLGLHDGLEERAENGGGNARPVLGATRQQRVAHVAVEISKAQVFVEQVAVDVGKGSQRFVEIFLPFLRRSVEDFKEPRQVQAQIRAVRRRAVFQVEPEGFALENAGVLGEQAEQDADEKTFQVVARVAARLQRVVKIAHDFDGLDVDGVLLLKFMLLVAGNEREVLDVTMKIGEREFTGDAAL